MTCAHCGAHITGSSGYCRTHKHMRLRLGKAARANGWTVDLAGGGWWVWDAIGNVLGQGDSRLAALIDAAGVES